MIFNLVAIGILGVFGYLLLSSISREYPSLLSSTIAVYYIENISLTGALNAVTAILIDYRIYDTLGELLVIFITISGIILLIGRRS
ncbi:MAG: hypothetical protein QCH96_06335 [Candidatus Thermoplasmatota archaeon]|nr:hypothetical protein [Candidatus Thermoplasmatota archaeon]